MKKNISILILFLLSNFINAQNLYIKGDTNPYSCDQFESLLSDTLNEPHKDILFFIHGRGRHPEKGLNYLPKFENNFNLKIIMFDWDSWISEITRPEKNAKDASKFLGECLVKLQDFKEKNLQKFATRKLNFMIHSMGNIVLQNYIEKFYSPKLLGQNLFDNMIMNAPDIETRDHEKWLSKVDFSRKIFVTFNHDDAVLIGSKAIDYKDLKVGRGTRLGAYIGEDLDSKSIYLDYSKLSLGGHEHFLEDRDHKIIRIFNSIFHDEAKFRVVYSRDRKHKNVLRFH